MSSDSITVWRTKHSLTRVRTLTGRDKHGRLIGELPYEAPHIKLWYGKASAAERQHFLRSVKR